MKNQYDETEFDRHLEKLNSDFLWRNTKRHELKRRILTDIAQLECQDGHKKTYLSIHKKRIGLIRRLAYSVIALAVLIGLLIGSAFVSPTMAKVISNIPYLGVIFQSKSVDILIFEVLQEKGYNVRTGIRYHPEKIIEVLIVGPDDYYNEVKNDVEKIVTDILESKGYNAYSVKVKKYVARSDYVLNDEETKEKSLLEDEVTKKLKQSNYKFDRIQVDPTEKTMFINIVGSKEYYQSIQNAVEKTALEVADTHKYKNYKVNVTRVTVEVKIADKRTQVLPSIAEGLMSKKEFKVTGVSYKSKPFSIIIKTSILSSDPEAKTLGVEIETEIDDFLTSEEISSALEGEPIEVIVNSKDNKKIN